MASKAIYIFAALDDLQSGLASLEAERSVLYVLDEVRDSPAFDLYRSCEEIPDLGKALRGEWIVDRRFRVLISEDDFGIRPIPQLEGGTRYGLSRRTVDRSLVLRPGGLLEAEKVVIQGSFETVSDDPEIVAFYRLFAKEATRSFFGQRTHRIGPAAVRLNLEGYSLKDFAQASLKDFAQAPAGLQLTENTIEKYHRAYG